MGVGGRARGWAMVAAAACGPGEGSIREPMALADTATPEPTDDTDRTDRTDPGSAGTSPACALDPADRHRAWSLTVDGVERSALIDVPDSGDVGGRPVVINLHGLGGTGAQQKLYTGLAAAANARGWIAVHPDGTQRSWDYLPESADVRFVDALIDVLVRDLCVDPARVYLTGLSNGGFFSYQYACDRGERVAAIAPVAGALTAAALTCRPPVEVPLLHIHGTDDSIVDYDGGSLYDSARGSVTTWSEQVNGCVTDPFVAFAVDDVTCETWSCAPTAEASLCTIDGGGHTWPGGPPVPGLGRVTDTIDGTEVILDFFERYSR